MDHPQLGVGHRSPSHLAIVASSLICPITHRSQPMLGCSSCAYFQGMLVGPDPCVLCAVPTRRPRRRPRGRSSRLIFDEDWPDD